MVIVTGLFCFIFAKYLFEMNKITTISIDMYKFRMLLANSLLEKASSNVLNWRTREQFNAIRLTFEPFSSRMLQWRPEFHTHH